jgi:hypothetical protein
MVRPTRRCKLILSSDNVLLVDPASIALQSATTLTAALALLFSRLEASRKRTSEPFDVRAALVMLYRALIAWAIDAERTNDAFQKWVDGDLDDASATSQLNAIKDRVAIQHITSEQVLTALRAGSGAWGDLRLVLGIYQPDLLTLLDKTLAGRRELIDNLVNQMPLLRSEGIESMRATCTKLQRTLQEVQQARLRVSLYIRDNFPPGLRF